ncbi:putative ergosterol biosynthesis-related protein [Naematelia encephala]|uniref:Putative ergosterol biosynthesis-related protein n=1 Tax=Naematelia encephala TaxID=71784 RepID=A0A1Y2AQ60_9TREE|nr:putative ergosterol biosynthesis-related protein [Naematelia encephala]
MSYLPDSSRGILPYWLLLTSAASVYNVFQSYTTTWQSKEVYAGRSAEMTPLASRIFGSWTLTAAMIRTMAAYNVSDPTAYHLVMGTYIIAAFHFGSELFVFKGVKINRASIPVFIVATVSLVWTYNQRAYYLGL